AALRDPAPPDRRLHLPLNRRFVEMVPSTLARRGIGVVPLRGEQPLPGEFAGRARRLPGERARQLHRAGAPPEVAVMNLADACDLSGDFDTCDFGQHDSAVIPTLSVPNDDLASLEVHVFHPELQALHEPQPGAIEQGSNQPVDATQLMENRQYLGASHHDGKPPGLLRPDYVRRNLDVSVQDLPVQEEERARSLILRGRADVVIVRQVRKKPLDVPTVQLAWVAHLAESDVAANPTGVG